MRFIGVFFFILILLNAGQLALYADEDNSLQQSFSRFDTEEQVIRDCIRNKGVLNRAMDKFIAAGGTVDENLFEKLKAYIPDKQVPKCPATGSEKEYLYFSLGPANPPTMKCKYHDCTGSLEVTADKCTENKKILNQAAKKVLEENNGEMPFDFYTRLKKILPGGEMPLCQACPKRKCYLFCWIGEGSKLEFRCILHDNLTELPLMPNKWLTDNLFRIAGIGGDETGNRFTPEEALLDLTDGIIKMLEYRHYLGLQQAANAYDQLSAEVKEMVKPALQQVKAVLQSGAGSGTLNADDVEETLKLFGL
ncbi:MAG: hypothetical protein PHW04_15290 [Candidatus Wallbacteria bacterium]|nr:hypothetical protein [Candidatus Wallbacteria bacterium]